MISFIDDFPSGASDDESAIHVYQRAKAIMKEGGFNLRKWKPIQALQGKGSARK